MKAVSFRLIRALVTVFAVVSFSFVLFRWLPGDPTLLILDGVNDPELEAKLKSDFGLDKSLAEQFFSFWLQLLQGNLGVSFYSKTDALQIVLSRVPWTLLLTGLALIFSLGLAFILSIYAVRHPSGFIDRSLKTLAVLSQGLFAPGLAVLLIVLFSLNLGWFPVAGAGERDGWLGIIWHLVLPVTTLTLLQFGAFALTLRTNLAEVLQSNYILTAIAQGTSKSRVLWVHALRNAAGPTLALAGMQLGTMFGGAVLTETVFAYPGLGTLSYQSLARQDYPVLQAIFLILAVTVVLANLLIDWLLLLLDPRIREQQNA